MGIYSLNNPFYLCHDLDHLLCELDKLYDFRFSNNKNEALPKMVLEKGSFWASETSEQSFNKLLPKIKSYHKDMYGIIEVVLKDKEGAFDIQSIASKFKNFNEFRLLNNKFKHFTSQGVEIDVIQQVFIGKYSQVFDIWCQFKYSPQRMEIISWGEFALLFLNILEVYKVVTINRNVIH